MKLAVPEGVLTLRCAGICQHNNKILFHRPETDSDFALPGGGIDFGEAAEEALRREMREELGATIETKQVRFVIENFFEHNGKKWHEIGIYIDFDFVGRAVEFYQMPSFIGVEDRGGAQNPSRLVFEWVSLEQIEKIPVKPDVLKRYLGQQDLSLQFLSHRN